jgi:hypothetical protein
MYVVVGIESYEAWYVLVQLHTCYLGLVLFLSYQTDTGSSDSLLEQERLIRRCVHNDLKLNSIGSSF